MLRVLTLNIWNRQGPYEKRAELLRRGLAALDADIIGLQEVVRRKDRSQADELTDGLDYHVFFGPARPLDDSAEYGNAILSRYPIKSQRIAALPTLGVDEPRSIAVVEIESPGGPLTILCTHLSWRLDHGFVREKQVLAIADAIDGAIPAILLGDFNAAPESTEIRFLSGLHALEGRSIYLADAFGQTGEGPGYTFDGRHNPFATPWLEPPRRIDFIFSRGPDKHGRGIPQSSEVVFSDVVDGVAATDHFGVLATISD